MGESGYISNTITTNFKREMKIRTAWKLWKADNYTHRILKAHTTIESRTRRYFTKWAKLNKGTTMEKYYSHVAGSFDLMNDFLYDPKWNRVGKSYHIWSKPKKEE